MPLSPRKRRRMVVRERDDVQCSGGQGLTGDCLSPIWSEKKVGLR